MFPNLFGEHKNLFGEHNHTDPTLSVIQHCEKCFPGILFKSVHILFSVVFFWGALNVLILVEFKF